MDFNQLISRCNPTDRADVNYITMTQATVEKAQRIVSALSRKGARTGRVTFDDVFLPHQPTTNEAA